jgi:hypothetical protein
MSPAAEAIGDLSGRSLGSDPVSPLDGERVPSELLTKAFPFGVVSVTFFKFNSR